MKLYLNYLSPYSQKTLVGLYEKQIAFTPELVNLGDPEARAAYAKVYPLGKVPLLVLDDGYLIPESTTILEYADAHFDTGTRLIPADKDAARRTRFLDRQFDLYVNDAFQRVFFAGDRPGVPPENPNAREVRRIDGAKKTLRTTYDYLNHHFAKNTWALGDDFTMADCSAIALAYARMVVPFDDHPELGRYFGRLVERPSVARVLGEAAPYMPKG
jgi:glutathione S-transferase